MPLKLKETCPKRGSWCSFRLVDEHGEAASYTGLSYTLHDRMGMAYSGMLDSEGYGYLENFYIGPLVLDLSMRYQGAADPWYEELQIRKHFKLPLTAFQVAAEQSPTGPRKNGRTYLAQQRAEKEQATFYQVEVRDFVKPGEAAHLPEVDDSLDPRPFHFLKESCTHSKTQPGIALMANTHHVLEVKALRALSPLLSRDKAFCALNAYHLSMMAALSYAPFHKLRSHKEDPTPPPYKETGHIGTVLQSQLGRCEKPTLFNKAGPYHLIHEEVPYSKRLEVVPYDPERYATEAKGKWKHPENVHFLHDKTDTQAFITHNDKVVLITVRGSKQIMDWFLDADAKLVPYLQGTRGASTVHRGFNTAFEVAQEFVDRYMKAFHKGQSIIICGHSLGGAIALLLAEWLRHEHSEDVQLYTFGSPRAADNSFVKSAKGLTHHRIVNYKDPVPSLPTRWMDLEWKLAVPGLVMLIAAIGSPLSGLALLLVGLVNLRGDDFEHHGEQRHYIPRKLSSKSETAILWQPGCDAIQAKTCAEFASEIQLNKDAPAKGGLTFSDHYIDQGYSRPSLTTLLRWHASITQRDGTLFSSDERKQTREQLDALLAEMEKPIELTYDQFRRNLRDAPHPHLSKRSEEELRTHFLDGLKQMEKMRTNERKGLARTRKRLLAQDERRLAWKDVFGDLPESDELMKSIDEWLKHAENKEAAKHAKLSSPSDTQRTSA